MEMALGFILGFGSALISMMAVAKSQDDMDRDRLVCMECDNYAEEGSNFCKECNAARRAKK